MVCELSLLDKRSLSVEQSASAELREDCKESSEMAFVNEYIPEADKQKYQITDHSNFYRAGAGQWTVDREREMFLMYRGGYGPEGPHDEKFWAFYWCGYLLDVCVKNLSSKRAEDDSIRARTRILYIHGLPVENDSLRQEVLGDLKEALSVYGVAGLLIPFKSFHLELDV